MSEVCSALPPGTGFVSSVTNYIDCQSQILGSGAWQALAAPGSTLSIVFTAFLTIFIALIGYNLLLGHSLTVRGATLALVKIGAVFALATSWPAYRTLVYDLVVNGPGQMVSEIGPRANVVGSDGTLLQRLDLADHAMEQLAILGPGSVPMGSVTEVPPPPFAGFDSFALGGSRILFLLTAIGGMAAVRIVTGLMLALGPFFIAFLMFDNTRSLFEGWVRVLAGAALAAVGVSVVLGLELAFIEPWLSDVLARRTAGEALPTAPTELFVIACLFTILVAAALWGCGRVASGFRLAPVLRSAFNRADHGLVQFTTNAADVRISSASAESERSRAAAISAVLMANSRRDAHDPDFAARGVPTSLSRPEFKGPDERPSAIKPVGRSFTRRPGSRVSAKAARRDAAT